MLTCYFLSVHKSNLYEYKLTDLYEKSEIKTLLFFAFKFKSEKYSEIIIFL